MTETITTLNTNDGPMDAFQVTPENASSGPALVVVQEAFGVNEHIKEVCRRFAREGYTTLAPDFYHRSGRLLTYGYDDPKRREPFSAISNAAIEDDVNAALGHLSGLPEVDAARIGIIGFCVGGFIAFLAACRCDVATAVCFYGGGIVNPREGLKLAPVLNEAHSIEVPVLCIFGDQDTSIPLAEVEAIRTKLSIHQRGHQVVVYPGAGHGFFCDERGAYKPDAAEHAWQRTAAWLERYLKSLVIYPTED